MAGDPVAAAPRAAAGRRRQRADGRALARLRDYLLAWMLLLGAICHGLALVASYLRPPTFEFTSMELPDWRELAHQLWPFFDFIAVLLVWLLCWALIRGRAMRVGGAKPPALPQPLPPHEQAASFGLASQEVDAWRGARVTVVHLAEDGHGLRGDVRQRI